MNEQNWYLGEVKFFDTSKGYGFIKNIINEQDHFVHISNIKTPINDKDEVVFQLTPSRKKKGAFDAKNVTILSQFTSDIDFLIKQFSQVKDYYYKKAILKALPEHCVTYIAEQELAFLSSISNEEEYKLFKDKVQTINKLFGDSISEKTLNELVSKQAEELTSQGFKVQLWLNDIIKSEPDLALIKQSFDAQKRTIQEKIYHKISHSNKIHFFSRYINSDEPHASLNNLMIFLQFEKQVELQKEFVSMVIEIVGYGRLNIEESNKVFEALVLFVRFLEKEIAGLLITYFYSIASDFIKLKLWLFEFTSKDDYEVYHSNFIFLTTTEQQIFIKKLFYLLSIKAEYFYYERILALKNLTHTFSEGKQFQLDFSCSVILASIESIKNGTFLNEESIFTIITKQVENDTSSLLSLSGFFEKCDGRSIPDVTEKSEDGSKRIVTLKLIPTPRNIEFCEGIKFKEDGKDRIYNHDCWWCRGSGCYSANQSIELPSDYKDFTLSSFLTVLNIQFDQKIYFDFLGLLNKINIYLKHLNCRSCNHILKPSKEGYYSYYRISNFICSNSQCENKQTVYLNHCLGARRTAIKSRCDNLIDSRDSVRCNYSKHQPTNNYEKYGPYICNLCGSCCSQKSFEKKQKELIERKCNMQPGLDWKVKNKVGHLEQGVIFCYKCGAEMINNEKDYNDFIIKIENPDTTFKVLKKGTNPYGFWYMIKANEDFFEKARQVGFRVSDTNSGDTAVKFIAQGNTNFLICQTCNTKYNKTKVEFVIERRQKTVRPLKTSSPPMMNCTVRMLSLNNLPAQPRRKYTAMHRPCAMGLRL